MNLYDQFETHGDTITLNFGGDEQNGNTTIDVAFAGEGNVAFQKAMERLMAPYRHIDKKDIGVKNVQRILRQAYAEGVVKGWSNVRDREGNPIDFTAENVVKLFADLPVLFRKVQEQAMDSSNFRAALIKADAGN